MLVGTSYEYIMLVIRIHLCSIRACYIHSCSMNSFMNMLRVLHEFYSLGVRPEFDENSKIMTEFNFLNSRRSIVG